MYIAVAARRADNPRVGEERTHIHWLQLKAKGDRTCEAIRAEAKNHIAVIDQTLMNQPFDVLVPARHVDEPCPSSERLPQHPLVDGRKEAKCIASVELEATRGAASWPEVAAHSPAPSVPRCAVQAERRVHRRVVRAQRAKDSRRKLQGEYLLKRVPSGDEPSDSRRKVGVRARSKHPIDDGGPRRPREFGVGAFRGCAETRERFCHRSVPAIPSDPHRVTASAHIPICVVELEEPAYVAVETLELVVLEDTIQKAGEPLWVLKKHAVNLLDVPVASGRHLAEPHLDSALCPCDTSRVDVNR